MAGGNDLTVRAVVEAILQGQGFEEAKAGLEKLRDTAKETGEKGAPAIGQLNDALGQCGIRLGQIASLGFLAGLIKSSVVEWANLERQIETLNIQLASLGQGAAKEAVESFIDGLTAIGRPAETTASALNRFLGTTRDADAAMAAVKMASDLAAGGFGTLEGNVENITALFKGRFQGALGTLGSNLDEHGHKVKDAATAYRLLEEKQRLVNQRAKDTKSELASMSGQWELMKEKIGKGFAQLFDFLFPVINVVLKVPAFIGRGWGQTFNVIINSAKACGDTLAAVFNLEELLKSPKAYLTSVKGAFSNAFALMKDTVVDAVTDLTTVWTDQPAQVVKTSEAGNKALGKILAGMVENTEKASTEAATKVEAVHDEVIKKWLARQQEAREADLQAKKAQIQAEIQAEREGSPRRAALERELLDVEYSDAIAKFKGTEQGKLAIAAEFAAKRIALATKEADAGAKRFLDSYKKQLDNELLLDKMKRDMDKEDYENEVRAFEQMGDAYIAVNLEAYKWYLEKRKEALIAELNAEEAAESAKETDPEIQAAIHEKYQRKRLALTKQTAAQEVQVEKNAAKTKTQMVADGLGALATAFPQFKAFAIAQALINTYQAATSALNAPPGPPWSFVYVAAAIAQGFAQVRAIQSQNVAMATGGVVTGPTNALVGEAGREAVVPLESPSAMRILSDALGRAGGTTVSNASSTVVDSAVHIHFNGPTTMVGGSAGVRELTRLINKEQARNAARYMR
ncbi:MAG: hypothetical protein ABFD84_01245 [Candidatus Polarisedimenticolia bacterium]|nr:hypothetical protein [bacterium]